MPKRSQGRGGVLATLYPPRPRLVGASGLQPTLYPMRCRLKGAGCSKPLKGNQKKLLSLYRTRQRSLPRVPRFTPSIRQVTCNPFQRSRVPVGKGPPWGWPGQRYIGQGRAAARKAIWEKEQRNKTCWTDKDGINRGSCARASQPAGMRARGGLRGAAVRFTNPLATSLSGGSAPMGIGYKPLKFPRQQWARYAYPTGLTQRSGTSSSFKVGLY